MVPAAAAAAPGDGTLSWLRNRWLGEVSGDGGGECDVSGDGECDGDGGLSWARAGVEAGAVGDAGRLCWLCSARLRELTSCGR